MPDLYREVTGRLGAGKQRSAAGPAAVVVSLFILAGAAAPGMLSSPMLLLLLLMPWLGLGMAHVFHEGLALDAPCRYWPRSLVPAVYGPGLVLAWQSQDIHVVDAALLAAATMALLVAVVAGAWRLVPRQKRTLHHLLLLALLVSFYAVGAVKHVNALHDFGEPEGYPVVPLKIALKDVAESGGLWQYRSRLELPPWGPFIRSHEVVGWWDSRPLPEGTPVCMLHHPGALGLGWASANPIEDCS
jgi:hypothetical protein